MKEELWVPIPGLKDYLVSSYGRVKRVSIDINRFTFTQHLPETIIEPSITDFGYYTVRLSRCVDKEKYSAQRRVHILVAKCFIPNPNNYHYVHHINGNILDNRVENLEWTYSDMDYFDKHGREKNGKGKRVIKIFGTINVVIDSTETLKPGTAEFQAYRLWHGMLERCYNKKTKVRLPTYDECTVCDEWLTFSNFRDWVYENYIVGYDLDKDILVQGNKLYSPQTCCFVPHAINSLFNMRKAARGCTPMGVNKRDGKYRAAIREYGVLKHLGTFSTEKEASDAYVKERLRYIKEVADKYYKCGMITKDIYVAMCNFKISA